MRKIKIAGLLASFISSLYLLIPVHASAASAIRITEIMYDPSGDGSREFVELYNGSDASVSLSGWSMVGVDYVFQNTSLASKSYLVIARNSTALSSTHPGARIVGQYGGKLRGSGELVRVVDAKGNSVSQVNYTFGGAWPTEPRNGGPSLSLISSTANETLASCWGVSTASGGSPGKANSVKSGRGAGCPSVAYPITKAPATSTNQSQSGSSSQSSSSSPGDSANQQSAATKKKEKEKAETKETNQIPTTESEEQAAAVIANSTEAESPNRRKWPLALGTLSTLAGAGVTWRLINLVRQQKDVKTILQKSKKAKHAN